MIFTCLVLNGVTFLINILRLAGGVDSSAGSGLLCVVEVGRLAVRAILPAWFSCVSRKFIPVKVKKISLPDQKFLFY